MLGGPDYEVQYGNGDRGAYVTAVYAATIPAGTPEPDGDELVAVRWFDRVALSNVELTRFAPAVLRATGYLPRAPEGA